MKSVPAITSTLLFLLPFSIFAGEPFSSYSTKQSAAAYTAESESPVSFELSTGWDSRYVTEGIDNLDGGGIWTAEGVVEYAFESFSVYAGSWYALGYDSDYDEVNLFSGVAASIGNFDFDLGYTYLNFPEDDEEDHEVGASVEYAGLEILTVGAEWYYSFEADGSFLNFFAGREFELTERLTVGAGANLGLNSGYIAEGHDGFNHLYLGLSSEYALTERVSLNGHAGYNFAIDSDPENAPDDEFLSDFFYGGVGVTVGF
ncbi:MAG: hypothetical protein AAGJ79_11350 [Verrucomicrobiota bacterium]